MRALAAGLVMMSAALGAAGSRTQQRPPDYKSTLPADHPAVRDVAAAGDVVSRLADAIRGGTRSLGTTADAAPRLRAVLDALGVPVESQMLVFSKTSVQAARVSPEHPRAIYFNDEVMVAHVPGAPGLELAAIDARRGPVFYTAMPGLGAAIAISPQTSCLLCHHGPNTAGVPGIYVGSVIPGPSGAPLRDESAIITDHTSAFADRWGGWYVNARRGEQRDRANAVASNPADPASLVRESTQNLTTLFGFIDPSQYLAPVSDIVALMTFEHQTQMTNLLTRVAWQARIAEREAPGRALSHHDLDVDLNDLADYMTFVGEAPLPEPIEGVSAFSRTFPQRGPRDDRGRSLRDFDLQTRLFAYPLTYLVYAPQFDALPAQVRTELYRRVLGRLQAERPGGPPAAARAAAIAILRATKPGLPPFWPGGA